jgi:hypothetical protein
VHPNPYKRYDSLSEFLFDLRHPNANYLSTSSTPLIERNPLLFWKTHAELLLAFWASIGFKPGDFMTTGMNEKRAAWLCRVLNRVTHPRSSCALNCSEPPQRNPSWPR